MPELDAEKERTAFLAKIFFAFYGIAVISAGGLITLLTSRAIGELSFLFWIGIIFVFICLLACLFIYRQINKHIEEIRKL